jgi:acyl carrier protein
MRKVFDDATLAVDRTTTAQDVDGWDSLTHINLIVAVEREFKIRFTTSEVQGLKNVGDLIDLIARKTT